MRHRLRAESASAVDGHGVRAHPFDLRAECDQKMCEILDVRLTGSVAKDGGARCGGCGDQSILCRGNARLVQKNIRAAKPVDTHLDHLAVRELGAELLERQKVGI